MSPTCTDYCVHIKWADVFRDAKEDTTEGLIRLHTEDEWPSATEAFGMQLFVRECYPRMFDLASNLARPCGGVVFTGNPGIGTSLPFCSFVS